MISAGNDNRPVVLQVRSANATGGGPEPLIFDAPRYLDALGYRAISVYMHPPGDGEALAQRAADARSPFVSITDRHPLDLRLVRRMLRLCREHRVDIWHGND